MSFFVRLWYDTVLDLGLNPGPPALEASTLPLGYQGGGPDLVFCRLKNNQISKLSL